MSDSDAYSYEYDESDAGSAPADADETFEYTDDDDPKEDSADIENSYYNAKAARDNGDTEEAMEGFESVVSMECSMNKKRAGVDDEHQGVSREQD
jgi:hypothetical protein